MDMNRRDLLILGAAAMGSVPAAKTADAAGTAVPWHQKLHRVGQTNMTERDVLDLNIEQWADYWASAKVDALLVSVTGILAFYPSKVPFHKPGKYLGNRD